MFSYNTLFLCIPLTNCLYSQHEPVWVVNIYLYFEIVTFEACSHISDPDRRLAYPSRKRWEWAMIFLVTEASKSRLLGQRPLGCKTLLIPATGSLELALLTWTSNMNGVQGQNSRVPLPSLWCLLCHLYAVKSVQTVYTGYRWGNRSLLRKHNWPFIWYYIQEYISRLMKR
jgi:hypothetical protein